MYPSAYYTYNPARMKQAEKAYFKQGKTKVWNYYPSQFLLSYLNHFKPFRKVVSLRAFM